MSKPYFKQKQLTDGVYSIRSANVMSYLLLGEHHALLLDTGYGLDDLSAFVKGITNLPLYVVNSHGHIDHACGNVHFREPVYIHETDLAVYQTHSAPDMRRTFYGILKGLQKVLFFLRILPKGLTEDDYANAPEFHNFRYLKEGDSFDLGSVMAQVIEIPGHTPGSIGLYCPDKKIFFASDGICDNTWLYLPESEKLSVYCNSIRKVLKLDFDCFYTGHSDHPFPKSRMEQYLQIALHPNYAKGKPGKPVSWAPGTEYRQCFGEDPKNKSICITISEEKIENR